MFPKSFFILAGAALLVSCGSDSDGPPLAGRYAATSAQGGELYHQAKQADDAGNASKAIKLYGKSADRAPSAPTAAQARFRQAQLLEQNGEVVEAFDAYQKFLERYQASNLYATALKRQTAMAQSAADGEVKTSFLGLKSGLSSEKVVGMLEKIRDNAPKSATASKAQFTIGELHQGKKEDKEAIEAYRWSASIRTVAKRPKLSFALAKFSSRKPSAATRTKRPSTSPARRSRITSNNTRDIRRIAKPRRCSPNWGAATFSARSTWRNFT
jgi:tetratricopeptide (TPR) repeat protein